MFFRKRRQRRLEMIQAIRPTSKASLKLQCLWASNGDVDKAKKLYDFFADDMKDLPDNDPIPATWMTNARDMANGAVGWFRENQDTLAQGWEFIRGMFAKAPVAEENVPLPQINEEV